MKNNIALILFLVSNLFFLQSCKPDVAMPKPRGFFKLDLPTAHVYQKFDSLGFPFEFDYPVYANIVQDYNVIKEENEPYWINVNVPQLNAMVYLSYKQIKPESPINKLIQESFKLTNAHNTKADFIEAPSISTPNGLNGVFYTVGGNAASTYQFYLTDNTKHFIRGALYFNNTPNVDSVLPAAQFLRKDLDQIINTMKFR